MRTSVVAKRGEMDRITPNRTGNHPKVEGEEALGVDGWVLIVREWAERLGVRLSKVDYVSDMTRPGPKLTDRPLIGDAPDGPSGRRPPAPRAPQGVSPRPGFVGSAAGGICGFPRPIR